MKSFSEVRQPKAIVKKIGQQKVSFQQTAKGVEVYIDGTSLDVYRDQQQAEKFANEFVKQLEGLK